MKLNKPLILASASPRRSDLLTAAGFTFTVDPSNIEENLDPSILPLQFAQTLALQKAANVAQRHENSIILGADTIVVLNGEILGKPIDNEHALKMLTALNGKTHQVITGFALIDTDTKRTALGATTTFVRFKRNTTRELENYVKTGEPLDKAGAYGIQGQGGKLIQATEGPYDNVVGLPVEAVIAGLKEIENSI